MGKQVQGTLFVAALLTSATALGQCPDSISVDTLFHTDFEVDGGGFTESGAGDWEYGDVPVVITGGNCGSSFTSPGGAHSGTKGWGTVLDGCYNNLGAFSGVGLTVDLGDPTYAGAWLSFAQWFEVFVNFDYLQITANGTEVYRNDTAEHSNGWQLAQVDLADFLGQSSVNLVFDLWSSTVVNRAGWYLDDVTVTVCVDPTLGLASDQGRLFRAWPVPATAQLNVEPGAAFGAVHTWALYDATGRLLAQGRPGTVGRFVIDVSAHTGVAVLELQGAQGTQRQRVVLH